MPEKQLRKPHSAARKADEGGGGLGGETSLSDPRGALEHEQNHKTVLSTLRQEPDLDTLLLLISHWLQAALGRGRGGGGGAANFQAVQGR